MQQPPYGSYQYPGPMYTPYMGGIPGPNPAYPGYYNQQPQQPQYSNPPGPTTMYTFDADAYPTRPISQYIKHQRHPTIPPTTATAGPPPPQSVNLKSTMKRTVMNFPETLGRQISNFNQAQSQAFPRSRVSSNPAHPQYNEGLSEEKIYYHMLVSFHNFNELHIENMTKLGLDELRRQIWPLWPDGVESEQVFGNMCIIRFRNAPWDLSGADVKHTYELIASFFRLCEARGYCCQTALGMGTPHPRFLFQVTSPNPDADYFVAFSSQDGRRITLVNAPTEVELSFGIRLREGFKRKIFAEDLVSENQRTIEVKKKPNSNVPELDPTTFFVETLDVLLRLGFELDASIPLGRKGMLGVKYQRELLVFRRAPPLPPR